MAYVLVITLIEICQIGGSPNYLNAILFLLLQLAIGGIAGYLIGRGSVHIINRLKIDNPSLYPILSLTLCIFIFSFTYYIKGNGYLAVYIGGLVFGNNSFVHKRSSVNFFDGIAWLCQLLMFLTLGLLVNPHELIPIAKQGLIISLLMIFISRPLSVFISLLPFRKMGIKDKIYISWCGLRGAVPIIFAILPLAANVPHAHLIFNIVFFCTLISLLIQGTTIPIMAKWLGLEETNEEKYQLENFDIDFSDDIKSVTTEITLTEDILKNGNLLMNLSLPDKTLVVMIKRDNKYFVPTGKTILHNHDKLLIITDDHSALLETYRQLGIKRK
jgi:cell volume regulation protein A